MTEPTLDLLQRAHKHLTQKRDAASPAPWAISDVRPWTESAPTRWDVKASQPGESARIHTVGNTALTWDQHAGFVFHVEDAELITLLHRTIDAQLKLLDHNINLLRSMRARPAFAASFVESLEVTGAAYLARKILNEGNTDA